MGKENKMTNDQLKEWLTTINPMVKWDINNINVLEKQIVTNVKECGYLNLNMLFNFIKN
jgi:hypothetical protein